MNNHFDLAVVGGGPAGSAAAITASRAGLRTLLLDRDTFPRAKVCGEFVSAESLELLGSLIGPQHPLLTASPSISAGRLFFGDSVTPTTIDPPARSIPRFDLDHALWLAAVAAGVDARSGAAVQRIEGEGPFRVFSDDTFTADSLIYAAGRWTGLLKPFALVTAPKWVGIKQHFTVADAGPTVDLYFFRNGYCGVQPVQEKAVNVCAMVRADVATRTEDVFRQHPALHLRSQDFAPLGVPVTTAPLLHEPPCPVVGNILQVGDAAGFIDPFLGDGISLALQTGASAARAVSSSRMVGGVASDAYAREYRERFQPLFHHAARIRRILAVSRPFSPAVTGLLKVPHITQWLLQRTRPKVVAID